MIALCTGAVLRLAGSQRSWLCDKAENRGERSIALPFADSEASKTGALGAIFWLYHSRSACQNPRAQQAGGQEERKGLAIPSLSQNASLEGRSTTLFAGGLETP